MLSFSDFEWTSLIVGNRHLQRADPGILPCPVDKVSDPRLPLHHHPQLQHQLPRLLPGGAQLQVETSPPLVRNWDVVSFLMSFLAFQSVFMAKERAHFLSGATCQSLSRVDWSVPGNSCSSPWDWGNPTTILWRSLPVWQPPVDFLTMQATNKYFSYANQTSHNRTKTHFFLSVYVVLHTSSPR